MVDNIDKMTRSAVMRRVRSQNTRPELLLRKALFARGLRYRLHDPHLPGRPDLVFKQFNAVVLVHGCLWHWHGCPRSRMPATNAEYWSDKINKNVRRDITTINALRQKGWRVLVVWECAIKQRMLTQTAELIYLWLTNGEGNVCVEPNDSSNKKQPILTELSSALGEL